MSEENNDSKVEGSPEAAAPAATEASQEELEKIKKDYLYLRADFDNFKKAAIRERSELVKYGAERVVVDLLDLLDNFDRALALELTPENMGSFKEGLTLTRSAFQKMLSKFGVTAVESQGLPFDPNMHEALSSEETDKMPPGHITQEFKKAYKLHDKLIRPAQVVVAKEVSKKE